MKIFVTRRAKRSFYGIVEYLRSTWNERVVEAFLQKTSDIIILLSEFPYAGSVENPDNGIRGIQLTRHIRVFYRVREEKIIIPSFF